MTPAVLARPARAGGPWARAAAVLVAAVVAAACAPAEIAPVTPAASEETEAGAEVPPIIAMQRARRGGRLVFLDETGARHADLTEVGPVPLRDHSPAWSPDGRWVVFASSRGREDMLHTSLWIIAAGPEAQPRRLTSGAFEDRDPAWMPDGTAVVFSSNRSGSFQLWRLELRPSPYGWPMPAGDPVQLTERPRHGLHPAPSPDGAGIAYTEAELDAGTSEIWLWDAGAATRLTEGPADSTPAWSPDGRRLAFAAMVERAGGQVDADLFVMNRDGTGRRRVVDEPLAQQTHPVWSFDGDYLFSTSLYRSVETGKPVLSSVTFVDLRERPAVLRALHDPMAVESRASPALARRPLDAGALHQNLPYDQALAEAVEQHLIRRDLGNN